MDKKGSIQFGSFSLNALLISLDLAWPGMPRFSLGFITHCFAVDGVKFDHHLLTSGTC
ncbi:hypothetical protein BDP27DRAFT_1346211 [Rhodocollybia butyracea]|uniref:Uncharacterized protein n=1 Tax=Rhodocollybia butyracea TaxID=206335 RepID=A0A9P5P6V8_9AGAR|nr:hypothetical protein BDP27DRAFT_1346211 [Rhodocollybia butyracea]